MLPNYNMDELSTRVNMGTTETWSMHLSFFLVQPDFISSFPQLYSVYGLLFRAKCLFLFLLTIKVIITMESIQIIFDS